MLLLQPLDDPLEVLDVRIEAGHRPLALRLCTLTCGGVAHNRVARSLSVSDFAGSCKRGNAGGDHSPRRSYRNESWWRSAPRRAARPRWYLSQPCALRVSPVITGATITSVTHVWFLCAKIPCSICKCTRSGAGAVSTPSVAESPPPTELQRCPSRSAERQAGAPARPLCATSDTRDTGERFRKRAAFVNSLELPSSAVSPCPAPPRDAGCPRCPAARRRRRFGPSPRSGRRRTRRVVPSSCLVQMEG